MDARTVPIVPIASPAARATKDGAFEYLTTRKDELIGWARKFSLFPYPFVTACCAMEFMAVSASPYDTDRFGAALPRFSPRQADLLMVVGTVTHKQAPVLLKVYEQMCEPKWVMAFGVCASSGGFYQNYATLPGHRQDHSGRRLRPRLPAAPRDGDRRDHAAAGQDRALAPSGRHAELLRWRRPTSTRCSARSFLPPAPRRCRTERSSSSSRRASSLPTVRRLRDEFGFDVLLDVTAVDWPADALRFEVVYHFYSTRLKARVRLKTRVGADDPVVDSLCAFYGSAAFMERECHDMYGIRFRGNHDLRPILLYEGFSGHPLRKDYPKLLEQPLVPYRDA